MNVKEGRKSETRQRHRKREREKKEEKEKAFFGRKKE
jgi:hypothetical protein